MYQNFNTNNINKITQDINIFKISFSKEGKILGIDSGKKKIGVAISDDLKRIALTHKTIYRKKLKIDLMNITNIIEKNNIKSIVLGLPLNKDGTKGPIAQSAITFGNSLLKEYNLPILLWDERFSTIGILREMKQAGIKKENIEKNIDAASATWILQSALDTFNNSLKPDA
jgi:putative Holliday junction resolvase